VNRRHPIAVLLVLPLVCVAAASGTPVVGDEPRLLASEGAGTVPVEQERWLSVEGFRGDLYLRAGAEREVRYMATRPGEHDALLDAEVWLDGSSLVLRPPAGADEPRTLEVAVPASMGVRVAASGVRVTVNGLRDELSVAGDDLTLDLRGLAGPVSLDLQGGAVSGTNLQGDVTLRGGGFEADLRQVLGFVDAGVANANVRLERGGGGAEADVDGGGLVVEGLAGRLTLRASNAQVRLQGLESGARLELEGAPLAISSSKGDIEIETDAEVQFNAMAASLHVNSWGGAIRGSGNEGLIEVRTDGAQVQVDKIVGPMRVQGDRLDVRLADISGELGIYTTTSRVAVDGAGADVTIENEFGDVSVRRAAGNVSVTARDGDVTLSELSGAVELWAESARVEVGWVSLRPDKDSRIENVRGDVIASFPPRGGASVEARSNFGRVESELPDVRVLDDGGAAAGTIGNRARPRVTILAEGSVKIRGAGGPAPGS